MFKSTISRLPILLLRNKTLFQKTIERKLIITSTLLKEKKKQKSSSSEKKTENKGTKFQEAKKKIYYKFFCKCGVGLDDFLEFLEHLKTFHKIENLNFAEILAKKNGFERGVKFYWSLSCQCGHKFSSSLCNADLRASGGQIEILKKYNLRCLKCERVAQFDVEEMLNEFLKERFKQKLIYNFYKKEFDKFVIEKNSDKILEGHIEELCEKCQKLGRHCGSSESNYQAQIGYFPPFMRR